MFEDQYWHKVALELIPFADPCFKNYQTIQLRRRAEKMVLRGINWKDYSADNLAKHFNIITDIRNEGKGDGTVMLYNEEE